MQGVFVGTFLIGLREGLEATLIVSIVGAFLKRNGQSTRPMFAGVGLAVLISVGVGVGLDLVSATLPQAQQEMMETVIGAIAVVFVTSMIIWMNRNAARLKGQLEREARQAINRGGALALVAMAFLAVLKEGFETAVFLLAAAETSHGNRWFAVLGGAIGILASIGVGVGLYFGGLKLNLGRFFRVSGVFLVLIAAGLVLGALRTAHEAGWVTIGQQQLVNFSSWMPGNSVQGALITGVFGIAPDPRLVEVLGWLLYTVPVLVVFLWPARLAVAPRTRRRLLAATSAGATHRRRGARDRGARRRRRGRRTGTHRDRPDRSHRQGVAGLRAAREGAGHPARARLECRHHRTHRCGRPDRGWRSGACVAGQRRRGRRAQPRGGHFGAVVELDRGPAAGGYFGGAHAGSVPGAVGHDHRVYRAGAW